MTNAPSPTLSPRARVNVVVFWTVQASALLALLGPWQPSLVALCVTSHFIRNWRRPSFLRSLRYTFHREHVQFGGADGLQFETVHGQHLTEQRF